jgi:hypothetical protein
MTFDFSVKGPNGMGKFTLESGSSLFFVGANGSGKTRLAVEIENELGDKAHRIAAHRALTLNPNVPKIREDEALKGLRTGYANSAADVGNRPGSRWGSKAAVSLLTDYDFLVQALFADQAKVSLITHNNVRNGITEAAQQTKFEKLQSVWNRILPHRTLQISGDDIRVSVVGSPEAYQASDMSDGERAVFYLLGQALAAAYNSLIIFDEPELHIHRSVMSRLWDELEALRPDCGLVLISHDLEFVASRDGQKYVVRSYTPQQGWEIELVPEDTGFSEEIASLILGSRRPVLFVEGQQKSLDLALYRACYPGWTIIPRGSCEEVIHSVVTMRANKAFTRLTCAGIVDADDYSAEDSEMLRQKGIAILPVTEIENIFLHPNVLRAIIEAEGFQGAELERRHAEIIEDLLTRANNQDRQNGVILRYCRRRIDRTLKKVDLSNADSVVELATAYDEKTGSVDIANLAQSAQNNIRSAIDRKDVPLLLRWYDDKGLLETACKAKNTKRSLFEQWIARTLHNGSAPGVSEAIRGILPQVAAS